jgi:hypothetical protein
MGSGACWLTRPLFLLLPFLLCLAPISRAHAAAFDEAIHDEGSLTQLEARAETAQPREQCFLYAELVHNLTELAGRQMAEGDNLQAGATLRRIDSMSQKIHISLARDTKRLKNTELLLQHTTRRLADMLHVSSEDDRTVLQSTLKHMDEVHTELLTQVFVH